MVKQKLLVEELAMALALLASKLEFKHTKNSYIPDMLQGLWEGKILVAA